MNNKGQMAGWEAVIILVLLAANGFTLWQLVNKATDQNIYKSGSHPQSFAPEAHFGGCANLRVEEMREAHDIDIANQTNH
jgi:hypothetical protein